MTKTLSGIAEEISRWPIFSQPKGKWAILRFHKRFQITVYSHNYFPTLKWAIFGIESRKLSLPWAILLPLPLKRSTKNHKMLWKIIFLKHNIISHQMFLFVKQIIFERIKKHLATGELIKRMLSDAPIQNDSDNEVCLSIEIHILEFQIWIVTY